MKLPQLRTPLARALVPVGAGIGFFVLFGLALWGIAAYMAGKGAELNLGRSEFNVGRVDQVADIVAKTGPILFQGLKGNQAARSLIIDHKGPEDVEGWVVYQAIPTDRPDTCFVTQVPKTRIFSDCDGRQVTTDQLRPASDVQVTIQDRRFLVLTLAGATTTTTAPMPSPTAGG
jgi:hypothetical protein